MRRGAVYFGLREEEVDEHRSTDLALVGPALLAICAGAALAAAISVFVVGEDGARVAVATMLGVVIWTVAYYSPGVRGQLPGEELPAAPRDRSGSHPSVVFGAA